MKRILVLLIVLLGPVLAAQNFAVRLWRDAPSGTFELQFNPPSNSVWQAREIGISTNVSPPWILMSSNQLWVCQSTNAAGIASFSASIGAFQSNQNWLVNSSVSSNYSAWYSMYTNIPAGITDSSNRFGAFTNMTAKLNDLYGRWKSGTNTAAGTNAIISGLFTNMQLVANNNMVSWTYLNQIIVYLSRLGPGLQQVYQPANDPVGH